MKKEMKAILEFNLPEDKEEFDVASKGMDWSLVAWDIDQLLRDKLKYGKLLPNTRETLEEIRNNALKSPLFDVEGFAKDFYKMLLSLTI